MTPSPLSLWEKVRMRAFFLLPSPHPLPEGEGEERILPKLILAKKREAMKFARL